MSDQLSARPQQRGEIPQRLCLIGCPVKDRERGHQPHLTLQLFDVGVVVQLQHITVQKPQPEVVVEAIGNRQHLVRMIDADDVAQIREIRQQFGHFACAAAEIHRNATDGERGNQLIVFGQHFERDRLLVLGVFRVL